MGTAPSEELFPRTRPVKSASGTCIREEEAAALLSAPVDTAASLRAILPVHLPPAKYRPTAILQKFRYSPDCR